MPYILTKFFEKKSYQEDFIKGNFYLSSLATFTKTYAERGLMEAAAQGDRYAREILKKQRNKSQRDVLEGTIASIPPSRAKEFPADMRSVMCTDMMIRALGYDYCNVMCFCKMEYRQQIVKGKMSIAWHESNMKDFGEYAIIVKNPKEFIRRLDKAISNKNYQYICGDVNYHPMTLNNKPVNNKHSMTLGLDKPIIVKDFLKRSKKINYDAFDKCDSYKNQNEWRIAVNNGVADEQPLRINVGNLSDIIEKVDRRDLANKMRELFLGFEIFSIEKGYYGNISRAEMKEAFYCLGENKGNIMVNIG